LECSPTVYDVAGLVLSTTVPSGSKSETGYDVYQRGWAEKSTQTGGDLNLTHLATFDEVGRTVLSWDAAGYS
jgi:hypothetical protein